MSFYNAFIEVPKVKKLNNVEWLKELPFYDELSIVKNKTAFSGYTQSYKIEIVDKKDVIVQLKASELSIVELFKDLLIELKGFKHQITLAVLLSKVKNSGETEYSPVYFNSLTKTVIIDDYKFEIVINDDYQLDEAFNEIIYRLDCWISHGSGWIGEEIYNQYLHISSYLPLSGSTYIKLPNELQHPVKQLINIQNNDNKCFMWCHVRHLNLDGNKLPRITKKDREDCKKLNHQGVDFPVSKKHYGKIEVLNKIIINVFCYENKMVYPVYFSNQRFDDCLDLFIQINLYIKDFNRLMFNKTKNKHKKYFFKSYLQCFSSEKELNEHQKDCLMINKGQK